MDEFEQMLDDLSRPELPPLRHQEFMERAVIRIKARTIVSLWWLVIGCYVVASLLMKAAHVPGSSFARSFRLFSTVHPGWTILLFVVIPTAVAIFTAVSLHRIYVLAGRPRKAAFLRRMTLQSLTLVASIALLFMYVFFNHMQ